MTENSNAALTENSIAFVGLNEPAAAAWRRLAEEHVPSFDDVAGAPGPVEMACGAWRMLQDPDAAQPLLERISISFAASLERCDQETLGLARSTVEAGRQKSLFEGTSDWLLKARRWLEFEEPERGLERLNGQRLQALRCLADAYQANELRAIGEREEARRLLDLAIERLPKHEPEIRARILDIAAMAAVDVGDLSRASQLLLEVQRLDEAHAPHHLAEIRLSLARVLLRQRRAYEARGLLMMALDALPEGRALRLRLEIHHEQLNLYVATGDHAAAQAVLREAAGLYGHDVSDALLRAERDRLSGRLAFDQQRYDDALTVLIPAIGIMLDFGRYRDGLLALEELRRALNRSQKPEAWQTPVRRLLAQCLAAPAIETAGPVYLQPLSKLAEQFGLDFDLGEFLGTRQPSAPVH